MKIKGKAWKYGSNIDTDIIIPARYLNITDPKELALHCMEGIEEGFAKKIKPGDIMVVGKNFGSGSSREHAPIALKYSGIALVIGESFARIFYRNAFNNGLPLLECKEAVAGTEEGDQLEVELEKGKIKNITKNKIFNAKPVEGFMLKLIQEGGLVEHLKTLIEKG